MPGAAPDPPRSEPQRCAHGVGARPGQRDITWLKDESLEDPDNPPAPEVLIAEIQEEMVAILKQFGEIAVGLGVGPLDAVRDLAGALSASDPDLPDPDDDSEDGSRFNPDDLDGAALCHGDGHFLPCPLMPGRVTLSGPRRGRRPGVVGAPVHGPGPCGGISGSASARSCPISRGGEEDADDTRGTPHCGSSRDKAQ